MLPSLATSVITCFDPRVDPAVLLGADQGEIGVLRNVGGRATPDTVEQLVMLREVGNAGGEPPADRTIIVLQHTQCGITRIQDRPDLLAPYFEVPEADLPTFTLGDPHASVAHDVALLRDEPRLSGYHVSGLVERVAADRTGADRNGQHHCPQATSRGDQASP